MTDSVFPNEQGELQPTVAADWQRHPLDSWNALLSVEIEYGITDRLQVSAGIPWATVHDADEGDRSGAGDFSAEVLYNLIPVTRPLALSLAAEVTLPTGDESRDLGEGEEALEVTMILAGAAGDFQWHLNIGSEWTQEETALLYSVAVLRAPTWRWSNVVPTLELSGESAEGVHQLHWTPGLHWNPSENSGLGLGIPLGLSHAPERARVMAYYTIEF